MHIKKEKIEQFKIHQPYLLALIQSKTHWSAIAIIFYWNHIRIIIKLRSLSMLFSRCKNDVFTYDKFLQQNIQTHDKKNWLKMEMWLCGEIMAETILYKKHDKKNCVIVLMCAPLTGNGRRCMRTYHWMIGESAHLPYLHCERFVTK